MDIFDGDSEFYEYIKSNRKYLLDKFCILDDYTDKDDAIIVWHDILKKSLKYGKWNTNNEIKNELFEAFQQCDDFLRSTSTFWKVAPSFMEWRLPVSDPLYRKHHKLVRIDESVNGEEK